MSITNNGKLAEREFEAYWRSRGKRAHLHRFTDAAEVTGLNHRKPTIMKKQPSDYLLTERGETVYAEVKSTENVRGFPLSLIGAFQLGSAEQVITAGGRYEFFVRRLHPTQPAWYRVPGGIILCRKGGNALQYLSWEELEPHRFLALRPGLLDELPPQNVRMKVPSILTPEDVR